MELFRERLAAAALTVTLAAFAGCACNTASDSGVDAGSDGGALDAGQVVDGGELLVEGGCHGAGVKKIIVYLRTGSLCFSVSLRRPDAGPAPPFPVMLSAPEDLRVDDGRVGICTSLLEQANGQLDQGAATIDGVAGSISWNVFLNGEPYSYNAQGTLDFTGTRFWFATPPEGAGITELCRGP